VQGGEGCREGRGPVYGGVQHVGYRVGKGVRLAGCRVGRDAAWGGTGWGRA